MLGLPAKPLNLSAGFSGTRSCELKSRLPGSTQWIPICLDLAASRPTQITLQRDFCSPVL